MKRHTIHLNRFKQRPASHRKLGGGRHVQHYRPAAAYRQRGPGDAGQSPGFYATEDWHEPTGRSEVKYVEQPAGNGYIHPVTIQEVRERLAQVPKKFTRGLEVVQLSRMSRKRALFPCYGMQWGPNIYLYPIEASLVETYTRPPLPEQRIEAQMYGGEWTEENGYWHLTWPGETIKDFYLNNVLIHELGHVNDDRNQSFDKRERFANWFAIEYGYRASRGRR